MQRYITAEVEETRHFTFLADETTDFARREPLSVCIRCVYDWYFRERLLCFATCSAWLDWVRSYKAAVKHCWRYTGINQDFLVGQEYDGPSDISGHINGV